MRDDATAVKLTEPARAQIRQTLTQLRTYLAQETPRRLTEADTKANFIEPIVTALGWTGIGTVTREYYVRNSQEFIDYVMVGPRPPNNQSGPLLAIEAKALQNELTEKHAAQLVQYCSVEGIEWAALTNAREIHFFNTFLKPDLEAKRVLKLDLLAFNTDNEFEALFDQLWRLSRDSLTEPSGVRSWLNQLRLDTELRQVLLDPSSATIRQLRRHLNQVDIIVSANDLSMWFRKHLAPPMLEIPSTRDTSERPLPKGESRDDQTDQATSVDIPDWMDVYGIDRWPQPKEIFSVLYALTSSRWPDTDWRATKYYLAASIGSETFIGVKFRKSHLVVGLTMPETVKSSRLLANEGQFNWNRMTRLVEIANVDDLNSDFFNLVGQARSQAITSQRDGNRFYGVTLKDLMKSGVLKSGTHLILKTGKQDITEATISGDGQIEWRGSKYATPSNSDFAGLLGPTRKTLNGWTHWHARFSEGDVSLAELRERYLHEEFDVDESA